MTIYISWADLDLNNVSEIEDSMKCFEALRYYSQSNHQALWPVSVYDTEQLPDVHPE